MLFDLSQTSTADRAGYDFCIAGAGVAGITAALKLSQAGAKVALLEAGGLDYSLQSQELYAADVVSLNPWPYFSRLRFFGGSSNHWTGRCRPYEEIDFTQRKYYGIPGWPITKADMDRYLDEAKNLLDLEGDPQVVAGTIDVPESFEKDAYQLSPPTRFKDKFLQTIIESKDIHLFINANVTRLNIGKNDLIKNVSVRDYGSVDTTFQANKYIVAMGGLENARILLLSDNKVSGGIGNHADLVGKCFMEHLFVNFGTFLPNDSNWIGTQSMQYFTSSDFVEKFNIGSGNVSLSIVHDVEAYGRTRKAKESLLRLSCKLGIEESVRRWITQFNCPGEGAVRTLIEQQPNLDSRIYLSEEKDKLGMRKMIVDWQLSKADRETLRIIATEIAKQMAKADIGRMKLQNFIFDETLEVPLGYHSHHMGTTRMARLPGDGVVNTDCQVFGVGNLYIAGSSVFPTGGGSSPTMPLLQLTLRLVDHLS